MARRVASSLAAVARDLGTLESPTEDRDAIARHYLSPLNRAAVAAAEFAERTPLGARLAETVLAMDEHAQPYSDDDHQFVVEYGLPQWWLPKTASWEQRGP